MIDEIKTSGFARSLLFLDLPHEDEYINGNLLIKYEQLCKLVMRSSVASNRLTINNFDQWSYSFYAYVVQYRENLTRRPYDRCVFNKIGKSGKQISIVLHVDDLLVTSESQTDLDAFGLYLKSVYPETRTNCGTMMD